MSDELDKDKDNDDTPPPPPPSEDVPPPPLTKVTTTPLVRSLSSLSQEQQAAQAAQLIAQLTSSVNESQGELPQEEINTEIEMDAGEPQPDLDSMLAATTSKVAAQPEQSEQSVPSVQPVQLKPPKNTGFFKNLLQKLFPPKETSKPPHIKTAELFKRAAIKKALLDKNSATAIATGSAEPLSLTFTLPNNVPVRENNDSIADTQITPSAQTTNEAAIPAAEPVAKAEPLKVPLLTAVNLIALNAALNKLATAELKDNGDLEVKASQKLSVVECHDLMKETMTAIGDKAVTMSINGGSVEEIQAVLNSKELRDNKNINVVISDALLEKHPELKEIKERFDEARENQQKSPLNFDTFENGEKVLPLRKGALPVPPPMIMSKGVDAANQVFNVTTPDDVKEQQLQEIKDVLDDVKSVKERIGDDDEDKIAALATIGKALRQMNMQILKGNLLLPEQQTKLKNYSEQITKFTAPPSKPIV